jgi:hypothetical protein
MPVTTDDEQFNAEFAAFIHRNASRIGTGEQAIRFALAIDDHFDMRQFLEDWQAGLVANLEEYEDYREWLLAEKEAIAAGTMTAPAEKPAHG